jgi:hypothetical protein
MFLFHFLYVPLIGHEYIVSGEYNELSHISFGYCVVELIMINHPLVRTDEDRHS